MSLIAYMLSGPSNRSVRKRRKRNKKINKAIDANLKLQKKIGKEKLRAARARRIAQEQSLRRPAAATAAPVPTGLAGWWKSITDELS